MQPGDTKQSYTVVSNTSPTSSANLPLVASAPPPPPPPPPPPLPPSFNPPPASPFISPLQAQNISAPPTPLPVNSMALAPYAPTPRRQHVQLPSQPPAASQVVSNVYAGDLRYSLPDSPGSLIPFSYSPVSDWARRVKDVLRSRGYVDLSTPQVKFEFMPVIISRVA